MRACIKENRNNFIFFALFALFIVYSYTMDYAPGVTISKNFKNFIIEMTKILPFIFILIGLFDVWIKKEKIQKHLGKNGGLKSYLWVFILAMPLGGGLLPALPLGYALYRKGARLPVVFTFLGAVGIARLPMTLLESTFLGWKFSAMRLFFAIPIVLVTGIALGKFLENQKYKLPDVEK